MSVSVYFFDPQLPIGEQRRNWKSLLGKKAAECSWDAKTNEFSFANKPLKSGVIVAHYSKFSDLGVDDSVVAKEVERKPDLLLVLISGGAVNFKLSSKRMYARRTAVSLAASDSFKQYFRHFLDHFEKTNKPDFALLDSILPTVHALDILCQAFEIAHAPGPHNIGEKEIQNTSKSSWWLSRLGLPSDMTGCKKLIEQLSETEKAPTAIVEKVSTKFTDSSAKVDADWVKCLRDEISKSGLI